MLSTLYYSLGHINNIIFKGEKYNFDVVTVPFIFVVRWIVQPKLESWVVWTETVWDHFNFVGSLEGRKGESEL